MITHYARKLTVKSVDELLASEFIKANHRQSDTKTSYKIQSIGLFSENKLLGVAVFSTPRTEAMREKYTVELLRMAFLKGHRVIGGASKLIKHFINEYKPSDLFTYQDTTGDNTDVYKHSGMTLVKNGLKSKKQYLVAPGKTLNTATRSEALGMAYATRYGPDRITGSKLGEVFDSAGKRKSNKDLFIDELGWHIEETTGDSVWEWINPNLTHYVYKTTASDSDKYYYGVSHVKKSNATVEDCLEHDYYGSGGNSKLNKFTNWRLKHNSFLSKEILAIFPTAAQAYKYEKAVIGDLWKDDPLCLNSAFGGISGGAFVRRQNFETGVCSIHGDTKFRNDKCVKCWTSKRWSDGDCEVHGDTKFRDGICITCQNLKTVTLKECRVHGLVKHQGDNCAKCSSSSLFSKGDCSVHGKNVAYIKDECVSCRNLERVKLKECSAHGLTKHIGDKCYKCFNLTVEAACNIHGLSKHNGSTCLKCAKNKSITTKNCSVHGYVTFSGDSCMTCESQKSTMIKICEKHGSSKFQGDKCSKCTNAGLISLKMCNEHGETKHRGNSCYKCIAQRRKDSKSKV